MTTPAPSSTLTSSNVTFQWTGGNDLYTQNVGTNLSATVAGLPANGSTLYVRLWSLIGTDWLVNDYTYTAANGGQTTAKAQMTTPAPSSTLAASTVQFQWTGGTGVTQYWLTVGTTGIASNNLYTQDQGTNLSASVTGLPGDGSTVYVRLWSVINGAWQYNGYTYIASH
jgi:hypothetical protein